MSVSFFVKNNIITYYKHDKQIDKVREYVGLEYKQFNKNVVLAEALGKSGEVLQENRNRSFGFLG